MIGQALNISTMNDRRYASFDDSISNDLFQKLCQFIQKEYGIVLNESKKALVIHRINKRISKLDFTSIDEYLKFIFSDLGAFERQDLGGILSTNKTYFFREESHIEFLSSIVQNVTNDTSFNIWSAGCSSGEEVYTIAMAIRESKLDSPYNIDYNILGTDISAEVLMMAQTREFKEDRLWTTPSYYKNKYFDKHECPKGSFYELDKKLLNNVSFELFNLIKDKPNFDKKFDIIFCRNVLIYFDHETRVKVVQKLFDQLNPGGYLVLGLTEGSIGSFLKLDQVAPSIFQKK